MPMPYAGHCLCGAVRYRVDAEPVTYYACHCADCQRRTGSAFALSMIVRRDDLVLLAGAPVPYEALLPDGRRKAGRMCAQCGTRLWGEPKRRPGYVVVQPGTLTQPCGLEPVAHLWLREAQPWVVLPPQARRYDTQPQESSELAALWRDAHGEPARR